MVPRDPLVVLTAELEPIITKWINEARYPYNPDGDEAYKSYVRRHKLFNPVIWLEEQTKRLGRRIDQRQIRSILDHQYTHTAFGVADTLLTAINRNDITHGRIQVLPNPQWSQEKWQRWQSEHGCDPDG